MESNELKISDELLDNLSFDQLVDLDEELDELDMTIEELIEECDEILEDLED